MIPINQTRGICLTLSKSPIGADTVALAGVSFSELRSDGGKDVFYCARDPAKGGKSSIRSIRCGDVTPEEHNVRSAVHEYGGGAYCILKDKSILYTDFPSHDLYHCVLKPQAEDTVVPNKINVDRQNCRFADFSALSATQVVCIMEDHTNPAPSNVVNSLVAVDITTGSVTTLATGHDFYSCPQLNLDGTKLAYIAWDHPNMPWDITFLYTQLLEHGQPKGPPERMDTAATPCSMCEPRWSNNDRLIFLSDMTGWYNLYEYNNNHNVMTPLYPKDADFTAGSQGWILGLSPYEIQKDGTIIASYTSNDGDIIVKIQMDGTVQEFGREHLPPTSISTLCSNYDDSTVYFVGGSTTEPCSIWCWDSNGGVATKVVDSITMDLSELQAVMSHPQLIQFPSPSGHAYGYYYPPSTTTNNNNIMKPPLLVKAHGGPTSQTSTTFRLIIQFWTSRGFAVLDVNYGGSTGYGKEYRQSLKGNWGIVDVNDVCAGADYCVQQGWVNPKWLCMDGSSAGGYTTLAALTFQDTFSAGASLYGVSDLSALAEDTHKFESRYLDGLVGQYPQDKDIYDARCPILFTEKLNCPILLLQGTEDKIVPPNQAERMFEALMSKGLSTALVLYKGEQHGFRKKENIQHSLIAEYSFFCQVFGIEPEEGTDHIAIGQRIEV